MVRAGGRLLMRALGVLAAVTACALGVDAAETSTPTTATVTTTTTVSLAGSADGPATVTVSTAAPGSDASPGATNASTSPRHTKPGAAHAEHIQYKIRNGTIASQAVNIGSWLLTEYWMATSSPLYEGVPPNVTWAGEYAIMKHLGRKAGDAAFEKHWKYWITEKDIEEIAATGLNTVRVTTGFWIVNDEDDSLSSEVSKTYPRGALKYLDKLINDWAVKYNLAVIVSLHAHEGSQNGIDHSAPPVEFQSELGVVGWGNTTASVQSSLRFATFIAHRYKDSPAFLGLSLMNEPTRPVSYDTLLSYYKQAYAAIRADGNDCIIITSPWLENQNPPVMADFMPCPEFTNVWHEFHVYYKWGWEGKTKEAIFTEAGRYRETHFDGWLGNPVFVGEWSLATPDDLELTEKDLVKYAALQMNEVNDAPSGWAFWAWRHDEELNKTSGWSMRQLLRKGIIKLPDRSTALRVRPEGSVCGQYDPSNETSLANISARLDSINIPNDTDKGSRVPSKSAAPTAVVVMATMGSMLLATMLFG